MKCNKWLPIIVIKGVCVCCNSSLTVLLVICASTINGCSAPSVNEAPGSATALSDQEFANRIADSTDALFIAAKRYEAVFLAALDQASNISRIWNGENLDREKRAAQLDVDLPERDVPILGEYLNDIMLAKLRFSYACVRYDNELALIRLEREKVTGRSEPLTLQESFFKDMDEVGKLKMWLPETQRLYDALRTVMKEAIRLHKPIVPTPTFMDDLFSSLHEPGK